MKRDLIILLTVILLIGIAALLFNKHEQEKEAIKDKEELHREYKQAASHMHMDLDESTYKQTDNPRDIVLTPTNLTFNLLDRWKFISDNYSEIKYPIKSIDQEDWVQVRKRLGEQSHTMEDVSIKIGKKHKENQDGKFNSMAVYEYIYYNDISRDYFEMFVEKNKSFK